MILFLLGAVAGLADQPLQTLTRDVSSKVSGNRASGLVSGVGKGLVGVITKPLGGAAEFVSQTSLGLLHSSGLRESNLPVFSSTVITASALKNSVAKAARYESNGSL